MRFLEFFLELRLRLDFPADAQPEILLLLGEDVQHFVPGFAILAENFFETEDLLDEFFVFGLQLRHPCVFHCLSELIVLDSLPFDFFFEFSYFLFHKDHLFGVFLLL